METLRGDAFPSGCGNLNTEHSFSLYLTFDSVMKIQKRRKRSGDTQTIATVKLKVRKVLNEPKSDVQRWFLHPPKPRPVHTGYEFSFRVHFVTA